MPKYRVQVTETINHLYEVEADSPEHAEELFDAYSSEQLRDLDLDGAREWDAHPWDVSIVD